MSGSTATEVPQGQQRSGPALPEDTRQIDVQRGRHGGAWPVPTPASRLVPHRRWVAAHRLALQPPRQLRDWRHSFNGHCPHVPRCSNASMALALPPLTSPERRRRLLLSHGVPLPMWAVAQRPWCQTRARHPKGSGRTQPSDAIPSRPWPPHFCMRDDGPAPRGLALQFHGAMLHAVRHRLALPGPEPSSGKMDTRLQSRQTASHGCAQTQHHRQRQRRPTVSRCCVRPPHLRWRLGQRKTTHTCVKPRDSRP